MSRQDDFSLNRINKKIPISKVEDGSKFLTIDKIRQLELDTPLATAGRLISKRNLGKIAFGILQKEKETIQIVIKNECEDFALWNKYLQLGDIVSIEGKTYLTKTGEFSILIDKIKILSICLYPFPNKTSGIVNTELLLRKPFIAGLGKNDYVKRAQLRSKALRTIREFFFNQDFIEVETPILDPQYGGGYARPFITNSHVYKTKLMMRISPEIYLKKTMVGGVEKIFEIGKSFRNEGLDKKHNFEFTTLEAYQAYSNYIENSHLVENLIKEVIRQTLPLNNSNSKSLLPILNKTWKRVDLCKELSSLVNKEINDKTTVDELIELCKLHKIQVDRKYDDTGKLIEKLYSVLIEEKTIEPTFYFNFPLATTPLAQTCEDRPYLAQRWDLVIQGLEVATGYTELVNAIQQKDKLKAQSEMESRPDEAMQYDETFIDAISYGIPPMGGIGIGIDRLLMVILNSSIREVVLFPSIDQN